MSIFNPTQLTEARQRMGIVPTRPGQQTEALSNLQRIASGLPSEFAAAQQVARKAHADIKKLIGSMKFDMGAQNEVDRAEKILQHAEVLVEWTRRAKKTQPR